MTLRFARGQGTGGGQRYYIVACAWRIGPDQKDQATRLIAKFSGYGALVAQYKPLLVHALTSASRFSTKKPRDRGATGSGLSMGEAHRRRQFGCKALRWSKGARVQTMRTKFCGYGPLVCTRKPL